MKARFKIHLRHWLHRLARRLPKNPSELEVANLNLQLAEAEHHLNELKFALDQSAIIAVTDAAGIIEYVNDAFYKISGYSKDEIIGKTHRLVNSKHHSRAFFQELWQTIKSAKVWHGEICNQAKDGRQYWVATTIVPIHIVAGRPGKFIAIRFDISDRVAAEQKAAEQQQRIYQMQKLEAVGTMANGIAHDFNNILQCFAMGTKLLKNPKQRHYLDATLQDFENLAKRGKELVRQVLTFSRETPIDFKPTKLDRLIHEAHSMLKSTLPTNIKLSLDAHCQLPILADDTRVLQIIINLCTNAAHAMRANGGEIKISAGHATQVPAELQERCNHGEEFCFLQIRDNGPGVPVAIRQRIFEPFFTTKPVGVGTGMGLAVVHGIVTEHKGAITIADSPGGGATFTTYFPNYTREQPPLGLEEIPKESTQATAPAPGNPLMRVLFVDDDLMVKKFSTHVLEDLGFKVTSFSSPNEALEELQTHPDHYDLVISDLTMPEMNGMDLGRQIKMVRNLPVILATGNFNSEFSPPRDAIDLVIMKPFSSEEIQQAIHTLQNSAGH